MTGSGAVTGANGGDPTSTYNLDTRRLVYGPVGEALSCDRPGKQLVENILDALDHGEGWVLTHETGGTWYPGRLAVEFECSTSLSGQELVKIDTQVVEVQIESRELYRWLNDLNGHSAGWWWWYDSERRSVVCSITCVAKPEEWWWPSILLGVLPTYATAVESMADYLADALYGVVLMAQHPERGARPGEDRLIIEKRLGPRDLSASLDLWLSTLEYSRLHDALGVICGGEARRVECPLYARVADATGQPRIVLRRHWHPELGWGWQIATLSGISKFGDTSTADLDRFAAQLNNQQHRESVGRNRFGGWVIVQELGLVHHTFVPAIEIENLASHAESTIGHVAALMVDVEGRMQDLDGVIAIAQPTTQGPLSMYEVTEEMASDSLLPLINMKVGGIGWPYLSQGAQLRVLDGWAGETDDKSEDGGDLWLLPRHAAICSFGIFNPMGPTVSSLEASFVPTNDGDAHWALYWVRRHPISSEIVHLGNASSFAELGPLISDSLSEVDPNLSVFGSGPDWLDIWEHQEAVLEGARQFATVITNTDWRIKAMALIVHSSDPWRRISEGVTGGEFDWPEGVDAVEGWLDAITTPNVIAGHQLFLRSAWEGASAYRNSDWQDPNTAQVATDSMTRIAHARARDDFEFRERADPFVKHPLS